MLENNAQVMVLSDLLSNKLVFLRNFDTDDSIDAIVAAVFDVQHQSGPAPTDVIHAEATDPTSSTPIATCNVNAQFAPSNAASLSLLTSTATLNSVFVCMLFTQILYSLLTL